MRIVNSRVPVGAVRLAIAWWALSGPALAATFDVADETSLRAAIIAANASPGPHFLEFRDDIAITASLPPLLVSATIKGNGYALDGGANAGLLVVGDPQAAGGPRLLVFVNDLALTGGLAAGGDGSGGGGGGLGAGGALLVSPRADVVLNNVSIKDSTARGGNGAAGVGGDGGAFNGVTGGGAGSPLANGAAGDFGGGGGSGVLAGGSGGFGAGGGAGPSPGAAGSGGGAGGSSGGGGGGALGGAIFVMEGGGLTIGGTTTLTGSAVQAGIGALDGQAGQAAGDGLFLAGAGNLLVRGPAAGTTQVIADGIADARGAGLAGAASWERWNLIVTGGSREGRILLSGANNYSGDTYILGSTLVVTDDASLGGSSGIVVFDDGGLGMPAGLVLTRDVAINSGGASFTVVTPGEAVLAGDVRGAGLVVKDGIGDLALRANTVFQGGWIVREGALVLDNDARLGQADLLLDGGGLRFANDMADLRAFTVGDAGAFLDNAGHRVTLSNDILGWDDGAVVEFRGGGDFVLDGTAAGSGNTRVSAGHVIGDIASGELQVSAGGRWSLGAANRQLSLIGGAGDIDLGGNRLIVSMRTGEGTPVAGSFDGVISGTGSLVVTNASSGVSDPLLGMLMGEVRTLTLNGANTYSGGTVIRGGAVVSVSDDAYLGSGMVTLAGGTLAHGGASSARDLLLAGGGAISTQGNDLLYSGAITGNGTLLKTGAGTLTLTRANNYVGDTWVLDSGSLIALADPGALGGGRLNLGGGGGLRLLVDTPDLAGLRLWSGGGVLDTGAFSARTSGSITAFDPDAALTKRGSGALTITGNSSFSGLVNVEQGTLQLGDGGNAGNLGGDISLAAGAHLVFDRANAFTFSGILSGDGDVLKRGAGTLRLSSAANSFTGGLVVAEGLVAASSAGDLGAGTLLLDNNGLQLLDAIYRDVAIGPSSGRLHVAAGSSHALGGVVDGAGTLRKTGDGTLVLTGMAQADGGNHVEAGVLQVGDGYAGLLFGDTLLDSGAALAFARADAIRYDGVVSGDGELIQRGAGELVLVADSTYRGLTRVESGSLRLGEGGATGSIAGDLWLSADTRVLFDRASPLTYGGAFSGAGTLVQDGAGVITLSGDGAAFTGGIDVARGGLLFNGTTAGDVQVRAGFLGGTGRIGGNLGVDAGAIVRPGDGSSPLRVDGDADLWAGSRWEAMIHADGRASRLQVGGAATLAGDLSISGIGSGFTGGMTFRLLDAATVTGTFARVDEDLPFLDGELLYGAGSVDLRLVRNGSAFTTVTLTRNQQAVAGALDRLDPAHPAAFYAQSQTVEGARDAYDAMNGDSLLAGLGLADRGGELFVDRLRSRASRLGLASRGPVDDRLASAWQAMDAGVSPEAPALPSMNAADDGVARSPVARVEGLWVEMKQLSSQEPVDSLTGNAAVSGDGQMLLLGVDGYWRDDLILGAGIGTAQQSFDFDNRASSGNVDQFLLGVYARWDAAPRFQLKAALGFAQGDIDQQRHDVVSDSWLSSATSISGWSAVIEGGVPLHVSGWGVRPFALLALGMTSREAFTEAPAVPAALQVAAGEASGGEIGLGVEASRPWLLGGNRWAQFEASAELRQPWGDAQLSQSVSLDGTGEWYTVQAAPADNMILGVGVGAECYLARNTALWGGYRGRFGGATDENSLVLSLLVRW